jgi:glycosyltransferase involved in cell wall biosynthesis
MFGWEYPPLHSGGLGVACQGLVRGLLKNGVRVSLVLPSPIDHADGAHVVPSEGDLFEARSIPSALQPYEGIAEYAIRLQSLLPDAAAAAELYGPNMGDAVDRFAEMSVAATRDLRPDVVHCHDWMTYDAGIRAASYHRVPLVAHIHATEFDRTDFHPNLWIAGRERRGLLLADKIIAVSNYTKNVLMREYGIDPGKIAVVHNAHDHHPQASASSIVTSKHGEKSHPLVLFLGRLTLQKNPWQFLEVARKITNHRPDVRFVMAGEGPMLGELIERACELGLGENIIFTGKVARREVDQLYRSASCFVMPSLSEPFGLVALEAIGHGVPVVISKQSGASEVIEHAFKVDFWDADKMADCILTILRETPLAMQLSAEAPRVLQKLSWKNQAGHVKSLYELTRTSPSSFRS